MAIFIPSIEKIKKFKVSPTDGELSLLTFIERTLDDSFEVYFNPYLNGDRPDILIMRKGYGVMVIEVKDCAVYFHCASQFVVDKKLVKPFEGDQKYKKFLYYNIDFIGRDSLTEESFKKILVGRRLLADKPSYFFTDNLYER